MARTTGTIQQGLTSQGDVSLIAHRGFAGVYPENTIAAVEQATSRNGVGRLPEMVELDVMPTADEEVVVFHDSHLGRVTDAPESLADRPVWELDYETLSNLEVLGTGEPVPRLEAVLDALPLEVGVNVELKNPGSTAIRPRENLPPSERTDQRDLWLPFVEDVLSLLDASEHDALVSSFAEGALAAVRDVDESIPLAAVLAESITDGMEIVRRYDCEAVHPPWNMIAGTELFNAEYGSLGPYEDIDIVSVAHREDRAVNAWTVESWYQATQLRRAGVDGLIADYPGVVRFDDESG